MLQSESLEHVGQRAIQYENEMLKTVIHHSEAGVYITDYETCEILFANQKTANLGGGNATAESLVGKTCWKALNRSNEGRCEFCAYKELVGENGELLAPYEWEHYFSEFDIWVKVTNQAIRWLDGRIAQITTFHNITEMKRMQQLLAQHIRNEEQFKMRQSLQLILDSLPLPIRVVNIETFEITYVNKKFLQVFEYGEEGDILGRSVLRLVPRVEDEEGYLRRIREVYHSEDVSRTEIEYLTATGKTFFAMLTNCVLEFNGDKSAVGIITDLTAEREQRRRLLQAAEREREANRLKSSFLSNMSHEIRTPMSAIIGLTDIELRKSPQKEAQAVYKKINQAAKNLLQIINDILDLSKIEANKVELFPVEFELEDVLNSAFLVAAPRLEDKPVELVLDMSPELPRFLIGDKTRLWQILRNLLDNAAKFTLKGSIVLSVCADAARSSADTVFVRFSVTDTGSGMNEEQSVKVFLPYEQIHDSGGVQHGGTGLGLPISKQLCELMGGAMEVESRPGSGTTMRFTLPFGRCESDSSGAQAEKTPRLSGLNVLIVDDSKLSVAAMTGLLEKCGARCESAESGEAALALVSARGDEKPFDIVLVDYIMEGMNGLECARRMRRRLPETTKILMLTAYANFLDKESLKASGVDDILEKSYVPTHFLQKLTDMLGDHPNFAAAEPEELTRFKDTRVLVCEDVEINREIISSMLEQFGIAAILAENGREGIEILEGESSQIDLVLMDLHMPVMDGYTATASIRSKPQYGGLPIISLTADAMVETLNECLARGFSDVITKPTGFEDLHKILLKWLPESKRE